MPGNIDDSPMRCLSPNQDFFDPQSLSTLPGLRLRTRFLRLDFHFTHEARKEMLRSLPTQELKDKKGFIAKTKQKVLSNNLPTINCVCLEICQLFSTDVGHSRMLCTMHSSNIGNFLSSRLFPELKPIAIASAKNSILKLVSEEPALDKEVLIMDIPTRQHTLTFIMISFFS